MSSHAPKPPGERPDEMLAVRTGPSTFDQLRQEILAGRFANDNEREAFAELSKDRAALEELIEREARRKLRARKPGS